MFHCKRHELKPASRAVFSGTILLYLVNSPRRISSLNPFANTPIIPFRAAVFLAHLIQPVVLFRSSADNDTRTDSVNHPGSSRGCAARTGWLWHDTGSRWRVVRHTGPTCSQRFIVTRSAHREDELELAGMLQAGILYLCQWKVVIFWWTELQFVIFCWLRFKF